MLKKFILPAIAVPVLVGLFCLELQRRGHIHSEMGVALIVVLITIFFAFMIWKAANELNRAHQEGNYFFNLADHFQVIAKADGYFKRCNPAFQNLLGYSNYELTTKPFLDFVHPDDVTKTIAEAGKLATGIETVRFENRYRCKDGAYKWFSWSAKLIEDQIYCVVRDVTEQKNSEQKLNERENYFRQMCEVMPQIVWTSEPNGNLDFYNVHWYNYTGMTLEQTYGWGWKPVLHPDDLQNCIDRWTHAYTTGQDYEVEYRFKRASDGQYRWHLGRALPLKDTAGKIIKWVGTCTDIDDQKRAAELLENQVQQRTEALKAANLTLIHSAKMIALGEMAGGVAHEINNPLTIIIQYVEMMKMMVKNTPINLLEITSNVEKIETTAYRIAKIVHGLRMFSREGSNLSFEESSLKNIVEGTLEFCREKFRLHKVKLIVSEIPDDLKINCRETQISQVLLNLLNNSFYAIENLEEKWIRIDLTVNSEEIKISVTDSGTGLSLEAQRKLFQPFHTTKPVGQGTGLGLSISKGIIESHRGTLELDITCPNTCFVFTLPRKLNKHKDDLR